jgi:hypothetical protein
LVVEDELPDCRRQLVVLPLALSSPGGLARTRRRRGLCGFDRVGGRTEFVRGNVCNSPGLAGGVGGMPGGPTQISGRAHRMTAGGARLHHADFAPNPRPGVLDRSTGTLVLRLGLLEQVEHMLSARCRPQGEQMVIGVGQGPAPPDRYEARVSDLRQDHPGTPIWVEHASGHWVVSAGSCRPCDDTSDERHAAATIERRQGGAVKGLAGASTRGNDPGRATARARPNPPEEST